MRTRLIGALSPHTVDAPRMKCSINSARWVRESAQFSYGGMSYEKCEPQPAAFYCEDNPEAKIRWVSLLDAFLKIPRPLSCGSFHGSTTRPRTA